MEKLAKIVVLSETQNSWSPRHEFKLDSSIISQLKFYLPTPTQTAELVHSLSMAASKNEIDVEFIVIDDIDNTMKKIRLSNTPNCCFWIVSDGRVFHNSGPLNAWFSLMGIKYYGIDTSMQALTDNKYIMSVVLQKHGVRVPTSWLFQGKYKLATLKGEDKLSDSLFVKPNTLGSQVGISSSSRVSSMQEAINLSCRIYEELGTDAIVQNYIDGTDMRVSVVDLMKNERAIECSSVLVETNKGESPFSINKSISGRRWKLSPIGRHNSKTFECIKGVVDKIVKIGIFKDYCAMDFRCSQEGKVLFLENNVKPFVTIEAFQPMADHYGFSNVGELFLNSIMRCFNCSQ